MTSKLVTYLGRPGRDPETDDLPVPRVQGALRVNEPRLFDDGLAQAAGFESGADFADMVVDVLGRGYSPPILEARDVAGDGKEADAARRNRAEFEKAQSADSNEAQSADEGAA